MQSEGIKSNSSSCAVLVHQGQPTLFGKAVFITTVVVSILAIFACSLSYLGLNGYLPLSVVLIKNLNASVIIFKIASITSTISFFTYLYFSPKEKGVENDEILETPSEIFPTEPVHFPEINSDLEEKILKILRFDPDYQGERLQIPELQGFSIIPFPNIEQRQHHIRMSTIANKICEDKELDLLVVPDIKSFVMHYVDEGKTFEIPAIFERDVPLVKSKPAEAYIQALKNPDMKSHMQQLSIQLNTFITEMNLSHVSYDANPLSVDYRIVLKHLDQKGWQKGLLAMGELFS